MEKATIEKTTKESFVFWQAEPESGLPESAILVEPFDDTIALTQVGEVVNINYESIPQLVKLLNQLNKERNG